MPELGTITTEKGDIMQIIYASVLVDNTRTYETAAPRMCLELSVVSIVPEGKNRHNQ